MSENPKPPAATEQAKKTKERSPGYPAFGLRKALDYAQKLWDSDKRQAVMATRAVTNLGFSEKSSAGQLALAAMKKFGLLEEEGASGTRKVKLSDSAISLLNPSFADREQLLKRVALMPAIYAELWTKYGEEHPSDGTIRDYLVFERKYFDDAVNILIPSYKDTIAFAKLSASDKIQGNEGAAAKSESGHPPKGGHAQAQAHAASKPAAAATGTQIGRTPPPPPPAPPPANRQTPPVNDALRYLPIPLDIGDAPIPVGMSEGDFQLLLDTLNLWKKKIVKPEFPKSAIWKNKDFDKEVVIEGFMGMQDGRGFWRSGDGTGIPDDELTWVP